MTTIQARPTVYNGIRMRSRLEADYAAHLDQTEHDWEYEPECFADASGQWLPDFGSTYAAGDAHRIFTEVKPAGPLQAMIPASIEFCEHVDSILRRMAIAWASKPDAVLRLVFWQYGGPSYLEVFSGHRGAPWLAISGDGPVDLLWVGMGQYERLKAAPGPDGPALGATPRTVSAPASPKQLDADDLDSRWPGLIGPLAQHTKPGGFQRTGEFLIYAESAAWATQTRIAAVPLIKTLRLVLAPELVRRIKVRTRPDLFPHSPTKETGED